MTPIRFKWQHQHAPSSIIFRTSHRVKISDLSSVFSQNRVAAGMLTVTAALSLKMFLFRIAQNNLGNS